MPRIRFHDLRRHTRATLLTHLLAAQGPPLIKEVSERPGHGLHSSPRVRAPRVRAPRVREGADELSARAIGDLLGLTRALWDRV